MALEEYLFDAHKEGVLLYLWRNQNTVVIGRNQNAWKECRIQALESDGGKLARRTSGGGAVFHDVGNLNFTFITTKALYNQERQLELIIGAVKRLGISASFTGRNDIVTSSGAKFSGNAFRHSSTTDMHHGTLLIAVDMQKLSKYLAPSKEKLRSKGVESVRSRVCNLQEYRSELDSAMMIEALTQTFKENYGPFSLLQEETLDQNLLSSLIERHASWDWRLGASPRFDVEFSTRFDWGEFDLQLALKGGIIENAFVFSDAMDEAFIRSLSPALCHLRFDRCALTDALLALHNPMAEDIVQFLSSRLDSI